MHLIKMVLVVSLLGFSCNVMSMKEPSAKKNKSKDESFLGLILMNAGQSTKQPDESPLELATKKAFAMVMYGQSPDEAMAQLQKVQAACIDSVMHPYRKQFEVIARVVCKDHGIQDGNWALLRGGSRAPAGSIQALMFRKFVLLNEAVEKVISPEKILTEQEQIDILDMYENLKPIDVVRLEAILKGCKK